MLKVNPDVADVTVIVPVATEHVGCVTTAVGADGVAGCAVTVTLVGPDTQPAAFFAVTVWVLPATRPHHPFAG